jgi:hypothetical protein
MKLNPLNALQSRFIRLRPPAVSFKLGVKCFAQSAGRVLMNDFAVNAD